MSMIMRESKIESKLFSANKYNDVKEKIKEIKLNSNLNQFYDRKFKQNEFNNYRNQMVYANLDDNKKNKIELLFKDLKKYCDSSESEFTSNFPTGCVDKIFELIMAHYISKKFQLILIKKPTRKNVNVNDFTFKSCQSDQIYYLECAMRNTSKLDKFFQFNLKIYFVVAYFLRSEYSNLVSKFQGEDRLWYNSIECILKKISNYKKEIIIKIINILEKEELSEIQVLSKFLEFVELARYAYFNFGYFLPEVVQEECKELFQPVSQCKDGDSDVFKFAVECIALKFIEKLKKSYFDENVPVVLAISLANFPPQDCIIDVNGFSKYVKNNLAEKIAEKLGKEDSVLVNIKNLLALIVDVSFWNWFEKEKDDGSNEDASNENVFILIYNKNYKGPTINGQDLTKLNAIFSGVTINEFQFVVVEHDNSNMM